jgi:hypothetical protein
MKIILKNVGEVIIETDCTKHIGITEVEKKCQKEKEEKSV